MNQYQQFFKKAQEVKRDPKPQIKIRRRKSTPFPLRVVVGLAVSLGLSGFYLAAPEKFESLLEVIEIQPMGQLSAAEKAAEKSSSTPEKTASTSPEKAQDKSPATHAVVPQDISHFEKLRQRKEELDLREKELAELEEELQRQKVELDKRIRQLEDMRNQIGQVLKDRVEIDQEKVTKLVDLYSNMRPKQAADIIGNLNEDLAVEVLAKMKKKSAAEIMNLLPPEKARTLSEKYTGYRRHGQG